MFSIFTISFQKACQNTFLEHCSKRPSFAKDHVWEIKDCTHFSKSPFQFSVENKKHILAIIRITWEKFLLTAVDCFRGKMFRHRPTRGKSRKHSFKLLPVLIQPSDFNLPETVKVLNEMIEAQVNFEMRHCYTGVNIKARKMTCRKFDRDKK